MEQINTRELSVHQLKKYDKEFKAMQKDCEDKIAREKELADEIEKISKQIEKQKDEYEDTNETYSRLRQKVRWGSFLGGSMALLS